MNKIAIKNFATWARRKLISEITYKAGLIGISDKGISQPLSISTDNVQFFDIGTGKPTEISDYEIKQRDALVSKIREKESTSDYKIAFQFVIEEVAYTWFNRLIAIRFMEVNDYLPSRIRVLSSEIPEKSEPDMVTTPFDTDMVFSAYEIDRIMQLKHENELDELFRMLFIKQCNSLNVILPKLFEKTNNYTELLLNVSFTDKDGLVYHLVNDIDEADFNVSKEGQVEIIGWLYQYYNTEPKDEAFALLKNNVKITKERIPAATQLFTPDWIVRYMVENSLGRLWLEGHQNDALKSEWKFYLDEAEQEADVQKKLEVIREEYKSIKPEEIKIIDPCMGSGHILVYAFDVLMQIYESAGYTQRDASRSILENNLYGLDIDDRAFQLAYFAVMMKARQYNRRILNGETNCRVYSIQESNSINRNQLQYFGTELEELERNTAMLQIQELLNTFLDAKEFGSILNVENYNWDLLLRFVNDTGANGQIVMDTIGIADTEEQLRVLIELGIIMAQKYDVVVTNPPYMGGSGMSFRLSEYVRANFPNGKSDLFSCFIEKTLDMSKPYGFTGLMTSYTWMFLTAFSNLRAELVKSASIYSLIQPEYHSFFQEAFVPICTFILRKSDFYYQGKYIRLESFTGADQQSIRALEAISNNDCDYLYIINQSEFEKIPNCPIAYWLNTKTIDLFESEKSLSEYSELRQGLITGDNDRFLRFWYECDNTKISTNINVNQKWYFYHKGGEYRKWYGNIYLVVNWENNGAEISNFKDANGKLRSRPQNIRYYKREGFTWTALTVADFNVRYMPAGAIFDAKGSSGFCTKKDDLLYYIALCNSKPCMKFLSILSPTMDYNAGAVSKIPAIVKPEIAPNVVSYTNDCIDLVKLDWDSYEISWDFLKHPLITYIYLDRNTDGTIENAWKLWAESTERHFEQLKFNEEALNSIFIELYGLENELIPTVEDKAISIRKANLGRDIRSIISYAVGCMFGRYSLDLDGLAYAGGEWDASKYCTFIPDKDNCIPITDEEYFGDDIVGRFVEFVKCVYGAQTLEENLDFIAKALDNKGNTATEIIRNYFVKDFYKDHVKTYQKRPVYWLYDSGKQDGFKALAYMHRYNADTTGIVRVDYLHKMQKIYMSEIDRMNDMAVNSNNTREVAQAEKRKEKLIKQLKETKEYDEKIAHLALSRIAIDLDDGVKVNYEKVQTGQDGKKLEILGKI